MIIPSRGQRVPRAVSALATIGALGALFGGALVAWHYHQAGLTLSHYDARAHLVVARRIFDSLTPGWQQIGAVWLPLPHLLNALPVHVDAFYQTGASAVAISIGSFALATAGIARILVAVTGSPLAAVIGCLTFTLNPNVLYLQATPMTEPLLIGLITYGVARLLEWCRTRGEAGTAAGWALALACLTRYEAWPVTASALVLAFWARCRMGEPVAGAARAVAGVAAGPGLAILSFLVFSRAVIGEWFVAGGFFVAENAALGDPAAAVKQVAWGVRELSGRFTMAAAITGGVALLVVAATDRARAYAAVALSLAATAALPLLAFYDGHPYRIRYMAPLMAMLAVGAGVAAGITPRLRVVTAGVVLAAVLFELRPLDRAAAMVLEAQWDRPNAGARQRVTDCLRSAHANDTVMVSMGSLGHYLQEMSRSGFHVRDFLHEGNGDIWLTALDHARPYAGWILIEEKAEGGDMLAAVARENPRFLQGFSRVCEGAGVALYRRDSKGIE